MANSVGSGIGSSIGLASEATWATWVTPTKWVEFDSETLEWKPKRIVGTGLANGLLVQRNSQRVTTTATVVGDIKTPIYYKGMGLFLGGMFGSLTLAPAQQGATAAYLQAHALGNTYGQSLSIQKGVPDLAGLIHQYNYNGLKITDSVLECAIDQYLMGTFTFDGRDYDITNTYATPSYQTPNPIFSFNQGTFRMGAFGSEVMIEGIRKFTLNFKRPMKVDNFYLDGTGRKQQQVQNHFATIAVDLESDYINDVAFVNQFNTDTAQSIILDFVGGLIAPGAGGAKTITAMTTSATGAVVTSTAHGFTNGQTVVIAGVVGTGSPTPNNGLPGNPTTWVVNNVTANTFQIGQNNTGFTYTSGGTATQGYYNQFSLAIPNLRWDSEPPKIAGPEIIMPKMKLMGLYDDSHTALSATYQATDVTL